MDVQYTGPEPEPEVITQQYAVRAVVDTRQKKVSSTAVREVKLEPKTLED